MKNPIRTCTYSQIVQFLKIRKCTLAKVSEITTHFCTRIRTTSICTWSPTSEIEQRMMTIRLPSYDYILIPLNLVGLPLYVTLLVNIVRYRRKQPFCSSFSKLAFCNGIFDILSILNVYLSIKPAYWGLDGRRGNRFPFYYNQCCIC